MSRLRLRRTFPASLGRRRYCSCFSTRHFKKLQSGRVHETSCEWDLGRIIRHLEPHGARWHISETARRRIRVSMSTRKALQRLPMKRGAVLRDGGAYI